MRIHILGNKGMLGSHMQSFLENVYACIGYNHEHFDAIKDIRCLNKIEVQSGDVVINCIGIIKPQIQVKGETNSFIVNSLFPRLLANYCESKKSILFHITTDCVYSGIQGSYTESDCIDSFNTYELSKALGEPDNCCIIRTSIIGEEKFTSRSLVEWAKSQKGKTVFGFTNHFWNGVTCLELAKCIHRLIELDQFWKGTRHVFTPEKYSKLQMLQLLNDAFKLNLSIVPKEAEGYCERTLNSIYSTSKSLEISLLKRQIEEMVQYNINKDKESI